MQSGKFGAAAIRRLSAGNALGAVDRRQLPQRMQKPLAVARNLRRKGIADGIPTNSDVSAYRAVMAKGLRQVANRTLHPISGEVTEGRTSPHSRAFDWRRDGVTYSEFPWSPPQKKT
jgi:hypothetical protein